MLTKGAATSGLATIRRLSDASRVEAGIRSPTKMGVNDALDKEKNRTRRLHDPGRD